MNIKTILANCGEVKIVKLFELLNFDKRFNGVDKEKQEKVLKFKHCSAEMLKNIPQDESRDIKLLSTGNFSGWTSEGLIEDKTLINQGEVITFPSGGTASIKYHNGKFIDSGNILASSKDNTKINLKYVYYSLLNINQDIQALYRGSSIQHPSMCDIIELSLPLPPLSTQLKIVEILDNFTELQKELQKELQLRKKQYEYYRDKLLTFSEEERERWGVRDVRIGEICMINRGASPRPIQHYITKGKDGVNWLKIGDVEKNAKYIYKTKEKITKEGVEKSRLCKKGDLILSTTMSWGRPYILATDCCIHDGWSLISGFDKNEILPDYLYYYLKSNQVQKFWQNSQKLGSVSNLNTDIIKQTKLEIPPLSRQKEIVEILDKFDTIVNDISKGLPREIELRRKQYGYYREKLLSFC